jgi:DNA topoisomerase-1
VGGERYAKGAKTFGLATLRSRHLTIEDDTIVIDFEAKGGKRHTAEVEDARLARVLEEMDALPGHEVLKYRGPDGGLVDVRSTDINAYIKRYMGVAYTAKDFRTWAATVAAAVTLDGMDDLSPGRRRERAAATACRLVAEQLNNTPAVCRRSYIDPRVIDHYLAGRTISSPGVADALPRRPGQSAAERAVVALLRSTAADDRPTDVFPQRPRGTVRAGRDGGRVR